MAIVTRLVLFHLRLVRRRSEAWRWMKKIILRLIDGSGELCLLGHVNSFALTRVSYRSWGTWMKSAGNCKMVKASV